MSSKQPNTNPNITLPLAVEEPPNPCSKAHWSYTSCPECNWQPLSNQKPQDTIKVVYYLELKEDGESWRPYYNGRPNESEDLEYIKNKLAKLKTGKQSHWRIRIARTITIQGPIDES
jgi:hypothetical protein